MKAAFLKLMRDEQAATAVEYGLLVGVVAFSMLIGLKSITNELFNLYNTVHHNTDNALDRRI